MSSQKTGSEQGKVSDFVKVERYHPYKTLLFFGLVGSAIMFLGIVLFYAVKLTATGSIPGFTLPRSFVVSTIVLLFSSYSLTHTVQAFRQDNIKKLTASLTVTLFLCLVFLGLQVAGWYSLYRSGIFLNSHTGAAFLYVITGLHFLHMLTGLVYLFSCMKPVYVAYGDMVKSLLYFSNRYQHTKIELLNIYWHYVDFSWLALFMMFLFTL